MSLLLAEATRHIYISLAWIAVAACVLPLCLALVLGHHLWVPLGLSLLMLAGLGEGLHHLAKARRCLLAEVPA